MTDARTPLRADPIVHANWQPTEDDLASWAKILLDDAYAQRPRQKCSHEDFAAAFVGALVALRWRTAFLPLYDRLPFPERSMPLPTLVEAAVSAGPTATPDQLMTELLRRVEARGDQ